MKAYVVGASIGDYNGTLYGRIYTLIPYTSNKGVGSRASAEKCSVDVARKITEVNCDYDLEFNRYGRVIDVRLLG